MDSSKKIINKLTKKAIAKQEVYRICKSFFDMLKEVINELSEDLSKEISVLDKYVEIKYIDKGEFEIQLKFSGDTLIFHMHTNTFSFDKSHQIWKSSYVKEDEYRAYFSDFMLINTDINLFTSLKQKALRNECFLY